MIGAPHLPFFLLGSLWAGMVPLVWLWPGSLPVDPRMWHAQEMVLGVAQAAMAGYLLTALPAWRGRRGPVLRGLPLAALAILWLLARIAGVWPQTAVIALAFPLALGAVVCRALLSARIWGRIPIALAPTAIALVWHAMPLSGDGLTPVLAVALLLSLVGGRVVPAFLRARLERGPTARPVPVLSRRLADVPVAAALGAHLAGAGPSWTGWLLLAAAAAQAMRLARWPIAVLWQAGTADLWLLALGWLWLPVGLALIGAALAGGDDAASAGHALTMGAMGGLILAIQSRAIMRRGPGRLMPGPATLLAGALLHGAVLCRLLAECLPGMMTASALIWSLAWAIAAAGMLNASTQPVPHPVLSARRDHIRTTTQASQGRARAGGAVQPPRRRTE